MHIKKHVKCKINHNAAIKYFATHKWLMDVSKTGTHYQIIIFRPDTSLG